MESEAKQEAHNLVTEVLEGSDLLGLWHSLLLENKETVNKLAKATCRYSFSLSSTNCGMYRKMDERTLSTAYL